MTSNEFDAIVIGAGIGGLCCAGELVLQGLKPLLIAEGKEVGVALKPHMVEGNRGIMQGPTNQIGWGGGWWTSVVRRLNVPVRIPQGFGPLPYDLAVAGSREIIPVPQCISSGADMTAMLCQAFPMVAGSAREIERILDLALNIPYPRLAEMDEVPLVAWLAEHGADETVTFLMVMLAAAVLATTAEFCQRNASVYGAVGGLRTLFGEGVFCYVYPDHRQGMAIPLARAIEARGGTIWRGKRVDRVVIDSERVGSVVLRDGTEARAPMVALACSNSRVAQLLDPLPAEVVEPLRASERNAHKDFHVFAVLDEPVIPADRNRWVGVLSTDSSTPLIWSAPLHAVAPWLAAPGKQFMMTGISFPATEEARFGGDQKIYEMLQDSLEFYYPGYRAAAGTVDTTSHPPGHLWYDNMTTAPKLRRTIDSVRGLWFVGEGSRPTCGFYMEAAASAGILGARAMAESYAVNATGRTRAW
jgi:phytoene dehydrogenase-like protein